MESAVVEGQEQVIEWEAGPALGEQGVVIGGRHLRSLALGPSSRGECRQVDEAGPDGRRLPVHRTNPTTLSRLLDEDVRSVELAMDQGGWEPDQPFDGPIIGADQGFPDGLPEPDGLKRLDSLEPQPVERGIVVQEGGGPVQGLAFSREPEMQVCQPAGRLQPGGVRLSPDRASRPGLSPRKASRRSSSGLTTAP